MSSAGDIESVTESRIGEPPDTVADLVRDVLSDLAGLGAASGLAEPAAPPAPPSTTVEVVSSPLSPSTLQSSRPGQRSQPPMPSRPTRRRLVLGIAGPPGAGKSTLASELVDALGAARISAVVVPMDGFHLAQRELERLGRADRKGAPDTFDVDGYLALLGRLRDGDGRTVYAPEFRREIEEPVAGALAVEPDVMVVVTEGNYLLHHEHGWEGVRALLDAVWYLDLPQQTRVDRLVARLERHGRSSADARAWALGPDERNARLVAASRSRADRVVRR